MKTQKRSFAGNGPAFRASVLLLLFLLPSLASANFSAVLQGQNAGDPTWGKGPLSGWNELDYAPIRVFFSGGPSSNVAVTINFDHTRGIRVGLENLSSFTHSSNAVITAGPTLSGPQGVDVWTYTLTVNVTNTVAGWVEFRARLSPGDHLFSGSSLSLGGSPSLGTLQINKPLKMPGNPDLIVVKRGPALATRGDVVTYTLDYSN